MKERTKIILLIIGGCFLVGLAIWNFNYFKEKNKEIVDEGVPTNAGIGIEGSNTETNGGLVEEEEEIIYIKPQQKFDDMIKIINEVEMPTFFDKSEGDPVSVISAIYPKDSNYFSIDIAILDDVTTEKRVSYNITNDAKWYEEAKTKGEMYKLKNGKETYFYDSKFHWQDGVQYKMMATLDFMTTNRDDVLAIMNTLDKKAKYTPKNAFGGHYVETTLLKPAMEVTENEHATLFIEYKKLNEVTGKSTVETMQSYDKFDVTESTTIDYIKEGFLLNETIEEKIGDKKGYYDENKGAVYLNAANRSIVFTPTSDTLYEDDKFIEVLASMIQ